MSSFIGSYSVKNLIQSLEYLLKLSRKLEGEITEFEHAKDDVKNKQSEAQKQGLLVKKMTNYMSKELENLESKKFDQSKVPNLSKNFEKFSSTETKLHDLRTRLNEFVDTENSPSPGEADRSLAIELKRYEAFVLDLTNLLNEKIATFEKIVNLLTAEKRESQQQELLLDEMVDLFNDEISDLEQTFHELRASQ